MAVTRCLQAWLNVVETEKKMKDETRGRVRESEHLICSGIIIKLDLITSVNILYFCIVINLEHIHFGTILILDKQNHVVSHALFRFMSLCHGNIRYNLTQCLQLSLIHI